jgi:ATP-dependent DNA ligase
MRFPCPPKPRFPLIVARAEAVPAAFRDRRRYEQGDVGQELFRAACGMNLEGIVSKRLDRPYARCTHWVKVKNREHPAYGRVPERVVRLRR